MDLQEPIRLNLGCAKDIKEGWINIDKNYKHHNVFNYDIKSLSFIKANTVEYILAKDILEHMPFKDGLRSIQNWYSWLKPYGKLHIQTTNWDQIKFSLNKNYWDISTLNDMLFAGQSWINEKPNDCDWHKSVYSLDFLKNYCKQLGFLILECSEDKLPWHGNLNLNITVQKGEK